MNTLSDFCSSQQKPKNVVMHESLGFGIKKHPLPVSSCTKCLNFISNPFFALMLQFLRSGFVILWFFLLFLFRFLPRFRIIWAWLHTDRCITTAEWQLFHRAVHRCMLAEPLRSYLRKGSKYFRISLSIRNARLLLMTTQILSSKPARLKIILQREERQMCTLPEHKSCVKCNALRSDKSIKNKLDKLDLCIAVSNNEFHYFQPSIE